MKDKLQKAATELLAKQSELTSKKAFVGFDGYVDKIQKPVKKRSESKADYFPTILELSGHLKKLSGKSGQIELVTQITKAGGNAPIMADTLGSLGFSTLCMGTMGAPNIDPVFKIMHENCRLVSIGPPAETNAFEFGDGKIIFSELSTFTGLDWQAIQSHREALRQSVQASQLVALVDWVNLPHCTDIWRGIAQDLLPELEPGNHTFFFDLADSRKKSAAEIKEALDVIGRYRPFGKVVLGLNENEAGQVYETLFGRPPKQAAEGLDYLEATSLKIYGELSVDVLMVHPVDRCMAVTEKGFASLPGRLVPEPQVLTGAGDNVNAGFTLGLLLEFDIESALLAAMATSGAYIANGKSPSIQDVVSYLGMWAEEV